MASSFAFTFISLLCLVISILHSQELNSTQNVFSPIESRNETQMENQQNNESLPISQQHIERQVHAELLPINHQHRDNHQEHHPQNNEVHVDELVEKRVVDVTSTSATPTNDSFVSMHPTLLMNEQTPTTNAQMNEEAAHNTNVLMDEESLLPPLKCYENTNKVDLMLVLDTSSSHSQLNNNFNHQRQIAIDLVAEIKASWTNAKTKQLLVGMVHFASEPSIALSLRNGSTLSNVLDGIRSLVPFTDSYKRIVEAIQRGREELERNGRQDAQQVFVLICNGNGQDYWNKVEEIGANLRANSERTQFFAVASNAEADVIELSVKANDTQHIFVGSKHINFIPTVSTYLNDCLWQKPVKPTTASSTSTAAVGLTSTTTITTPSLVKNSLKKRFLTKEQ